MRVTQLRASIEAAKEAGLLLAQRPIEDVVEVLDTVVASWLAPDSVWMRSAVAELAAASGFSEAMLRHGLPLQLSPLRASGLRDLLRRELGVEAGLGGPRLGPTRVFAHILAGNIPALAAAPIVLSLAVQRVAIVKPGAGDTIFPPLFHRALAAVDADLARCVVVAYWRGGDTELESEVFGAADVVIAQGSDMALRALEARAPGRFLGHGHKVSFAMVGREELAGEESARRVARELAYDTSLWDQQGCLSPQTAYVEQDAPVSVRRFAEWVAEALDAWATELPPRSLDLAERAAILRFRQDAEWNDTEGSRLLASPGSTAWTVHLDPDPRLLPTCLNRCLRIVPTHGLEEVPRRWAARREWLEAAGLAVGERFDRLACILEAAGVHRVCSLGTMQEPDLTWRPGGRPRLLDWLGPMPIR